MLYYSGGGQVVDASEADVAQLVASAQPVYDMMEADQQTAAIIEQVRGLKEGWTEDEGPVSCGSS